MPPAPGGKRGRLELRLRERAFALEHRNAQANERGIAAFCHPLPADLAIGHQCFFLALVEALELHAGGGVPFRGAGAGGLVDLEIGAGVIAQQIPVAIGKPGGARHGSGFMGRPETEHESASQLVLVLLEHARQLDHDGVSRCVVGGGFAGPRVLVSAHDDEVVRLSPFRRRQLCSRDLYRTPAVGNMRSQPDLDGPLCTQVLELQTGDARNANARNGCHLALVGLGCRVTPHRLDRAEGHGRVFRVPPVHHHRADGALHGGDALLLVTTWRIRQLRQDDLAANIFAFEVGR